MQTITKEELKNAAVLVLKLSEIDDGFLEGLKTILPEGCVVVVMRNGDSLEVLTEYQMNLAGWERSETGHPLI